VDEAKTTKSNRLVTFCPKCPAHLNGGMYGELPAGKDVQMEMKDLVSVLAEVIMNSNGGQ
jgi:Fe-S oxidoreductase